MISSNKPNVGVYVAPTTFTPTVTLVGGAGNTVPVYTTNTGRYERIGKRVFVEIYLNGDGGAEGAGTGVMNIAIPIAVSSGHPSGVFPCGTVRNNTSNKDAFGVLAGSTIALKMVADTAGALNNDFVDVTGADQNNATRAIMLKFAYDVT